MDNPDLAKDSPDGWIADKVIWQGAWHAIAQRGSDAGGVSCEHLFGIVYSTVRRVVRLQYAALEVGGVFGAKVRI